jgi:hypothetical protein
VKTNENSPPFVTRGQRVSVSSPFLLNTPAKFAFADIIGEAKDVRASAALAQGRRPPALRFFSKLD